MNTLVFSIALGGYERLFGKCIRTHRTFCKNYEYEYILINRTPGVLQPAEASWLKIPLIILALENHWDWVMFIDADCEIRPFCPPIESVIKQDKSVYLVPGYSGRPNAGVIITRQHLDALTFFRTILKNADQPVPEEDRALYENGHVIYYSKQNSAIAYLDRRWNNNAKLEQDSFIQHYSGGPLRDFYLSIPEARFWHLMLRIRKKAVRLANKTTSQKKLVGSAEPLVDRLARYTKFCNERYSRFRQVDNVEDYY